MRYLVLVKATSDATGEVPPPGPHAAELARFHQDLLKSGVLLDSGTLQPSASAVRVDGENGARVVRPGPFADACGGLSAFWILQVRSREEAVEWARRVPLPAGREVELRPFSDATDQGAAAAAADVPGMQRR